MDLAPIALFVYNRPSHTRKVIESLLLNPLARDSDLFVFADGAKNGSADGAVAEVRSLADELSGFRSVTVVARDRNWGLSRSVTDGVSYLCKEYGRTIVLEDDLVMAPQFLDYMNAALTAFAGEERVMHVSGYSFPVHDPARLPESFFYRAPSSWGWGTWQRAWRNFEPDARRLLDQIEASGRRRDFDVEATTGFRRMLELQSRGNIDSWAIRWYASMFLLEGLALYPRSALVANSGHDGSGVHCGVTDVFDVQLAQESVHEFPDRIIESPEAVAQIQAFYRSLKAPLHRRVLRAFRRLSAPR